MANSVDAGWILQTAAGDLGLHGLLRPFCPSIGINPESSIQIIADNFLYDFVFIIQRKNGSKFSCPLSAEDLQEITNPFFSKKYIKKMSSALF